MFRFLNYRQLMTGQSLKTGFRVLLALVLAAVGVLLIVDRDGLHAEYFALSLPWEGKPFNTATSDPRLESVSQIRDALMIDVGFSVRWTGWWYVAEHGKHQFFFDADDGGYLRIDDELVAELGAVPEPRQIGSKLLEPGFHRLEIGLYQRQEESRLAVDWAPPGKTLEAAVPLPVADLYAQRPLALHRALRSSLAVWPRAYRQLLGSALLLAAALLLSGFATRFERMTAQLRTRWATIDGRSLRMALLLGLFVTAFASIFPFTGTVAGGDDTAYLHVANFTKRSWFFNRYAHVYLLKLFINLVGGDPFTAVRLWWSFVFASTVAALAVAVRSIGPNLQLRTLAVTLFLFFAQTPVFGLIGAGFADFTTMMFLTVAVAVYLHGLASRRERPPPRPRPEWHILVLGALTMAAMRSKEVGSVLLLLPVLFLFDSGRLDFRRFARRLGYWVAGAVGVLLVLTLLDQWLLGDSAFPFDFDRFRKSGKMNFPKQLALRRPAANWLNTIWSPQNHPANLSLRYLWIGVAAAALVAGFRRRRLELRLLHFMPIVYLLSLIALYIRMPHPFSTRMLIPILPVACLMAAFLLHYAGLDDLPRKRLLAPSFLFPAGLAAALVLFVATPYRMGTLQADSLLPVDLLLRYGWQPDSFMVGVLLPVVVLIGVSCVALAADQRRVRVAGLLVTYLVVFGVGFEVTRGSLANRWAIQTGALLQYPWKTFGDELRADDAQSIALSHDLQWRLGMTAATRRSLGSLGLLKNDLQVTLNRRLRKRADAAIASTSAYSKWRRESPSLAYALEATATFDPAGVLVLLRPKEAVEYAARLRRSRVVAELTPEQWDQKLTQLQSESDPEARDRLLQRILDNETIGVRLGDHLRAVALFADGWTRGSSPGGVIVSNPGEAPWQPQIRLAVTAAASEYPIRVSWNDGERTETVQFEQGGSRTIGVGILPPNSSRLFVLSSDTAWRPHSGGQRELGVRVLGLVDP